MEHTEFDELAGRIEGVAQALLRLTAELEMARGIDGPRLSAGWRRAVTDKPAAKARETARQTLLQLAGALDEARHWRDASLCAPRA